MGRGGAEDKDEARTEGRRRELPPPVISAGKGGLAKRSGNHSTLFCLTPGWKPLMGIKRIEMKVCVCVANSMTWAQESPRRLIIWGKCTFLSKCNNGVALVHVCYFIKRNSVTDS